MPRAQARFVGRPPDITFQDAEDWVELWEAADFDPWETLAWETVQLMRTRDWQGHSAALLFDNSLLTVWNANAGSLFGLYD
jgi:hypothetical protein